MPRVGRIALVYGLPGKAGSFLDRVFFLTMMGERERLPQNNQFVVIARIVRPQGRRGEVLADILTDFPEKFAERRELWIASGDGSYPEEYKLQEHWFHKGRVVLKLAGVDCISDAEQLSGKLVQIPAESRAALDAESFYVSDLIGSTLMDMRDGGLAGAHSRVVGKISDVQQQAGAAPILVVQNGTHEYEIPFAQEHLLEFDAEKKLLRMKLPAGLLEINAPLTEDEKRRSS